MMSLPSNVLLLTCLALVKCDSFRDYFQNFLMREKIACVFEEYNVGEDVLLHAPKKMLTVAVGDTAVTPGDKVLPQLLASPPQVSWDCEDPHITGAESAIVMVAADPGNQTLLWVVDRITGCEVSNGQEIYKYHAPSSRPSSKHLYVICQFVRLPSFWDYWSYSRPKVNPKKFSMARFAKNGRYGEPYACNFIVTQERVTESNDEAYNMESRSSCDAYSDLYALM